MDKYIKRDDVLALAREYYSQGLKEEAVPVRAIKNIPSADVGKWISVEEKLPDFEGAVLCMRKSHIRVGLSYQEILYFDYDDQWFKDMFSDFFVEEGCITHWMPLPEPPKEETDG